MAIGERKSTPKPGRISSTNSPAGTSKPAPAAKKGSLSESLFPQIKRLIWIPHDGTDLLKKQSRNAFRPGPPGNLYPQTGTANGSAPAPSTKTNYLSPISDPYLLPTLARRQKP